MRIVSALLIAVVLLAGCTFGSPGVPGASSSPSSAPSASASSQPSAAPSATARPTPTLVASSSASAQPSTSASASASASAAPSASASTSPSPVPPAQGTITITEPVANATISSPLTIKGSTNFWPFEATLVAHVLDASGNELGIGPVMVDAPDIGQGGPFEGQIEFTAPAQDQNGTLEVFEASAKDGSIVTIARVPVRLRGGSAASGLTLDSPAEGVAVTLPMHVAVRGAPPNQDLTARLTFGNGVILESQMPVVTGSDGRGYGVLNLAWNTESAPPATPSGAAVFEIARSDGTIAKRVNINILPEDQTQLVDVAWTSPGSEELIVFKQAIGRTPQIASAALRELVNGPPDGNLAGATTALPSLQEIVTYSGREADWGYEVRLLKLTITNGVATANFSKELRAYGGGSARVAMITRQIERTLKQFSSVQQVVIQIDGQSDALQP